MPRNPSSDDVQTPSADLTRAPSTKPHVIHDTKPKANVVDGHADLHPLRFGIFEDVYSPVHFAELDHWTSRSLRFDCTGWLRAELHTPAQPARSMKRGGSRSVSLCATSRSALRKEIATSYL